MSIAELRSQLANPLGLKDAHRQRLWILARQLARVRALGVGYDQVELSPYAAAALDRTVAIH